MSKCAHNIKSQLVYVLYNKKRHHTCEMLYCKRPDKNIILEHMEDPLQIILPPNNFEWKQKKPQQKLGKPRESSRSYHEKLIARKM